MAYRWGHKVFQYIDEEWGEDVVRDWVFAFRGNFGGQIGRPLARVLNMEPEEFDAASRTWMRRKYKDYADRGVRANWVTVGWVPTEGELALRKTQGRGIEWLEEQGRRIVPLGRMQTAQDMADTVRFLLSDASAMVTGAEIPVTGGLQLEYGASEMEP